MASQPPHEGSALFPWYSRLLDLGQFEVEHGRVRFFEMAKIHLAILTGAFALGAYAIAHQNRLALVLVTAISVFGGFNAYAWIRQIKSSSTWEARWYATAAEVECTELFRHLLGTGCVARAFSHEEVRGNFEPAKKRRGPSPRVYLSFAGSLVVLHSILAVFWLVLCFIGPERFFVK